MKSLTIRMRVTLWYAFFMMVLIGLSLLLIKDMSTRTVVNNQKEHLVEIVTDSLDDLGNVDMQYYEYGVHLMIYDENETYVDGVIPEDFSKDIPLVNGKIRLVGSGNEKYYIYDKAIEEPGDVSWVRGAFLQSDPDPINTFIIPGISWFLPIMVLITCGIGYFITRRAFRPVARIQQTAQDIADSDQLSLRIGLPEGKDEIAKLGKTVDYMLDKLERSFEKEKQFTSDVSHELRTPLAVILAESEYTLAYAENLEEAKESIAVVNRQANRMLELMNQLLFFSRSDQGQLILNVESISVVDLVSELVEEYRELPDTKDIRIVITNHIKGDVTIRADKMLFTRCVSNLINNAISYGKEHGHIDINIFCEDSKVGIAVSDDGIGIAGEHLEKIWDRFYQVEESRNKEKGSSMGLGLSMVKMIVEKHEGSVDVTSKLNEGSTFTLYFPK